MNRTVYISVLIGVISFLSACAPRVPFTQEVREKYNLSAEELNAIQFYTSHDIVLQRGEEHDKKKTTEKGALKIKSGKSVEKVVIPKGTPGVVERVIDENRVAVSFEVGENTFLVFGTPGKENGVYTLLAADWANGRGKISYGGKTYYSAPGSSNIYLQLKMKSLREFKKQQRVVKGRKVN